MKPDARLPKLKARIKSRIEGGIEQMVGGMRLATKYEGNDADFLGWASDRAWDMVTYQMIGYYSGALETLLSLADGTSTRLGRQVEDRARAYVYTT